MTTTNALSFLPLSRAAQALRVGVVDGVVTVSGILGQRGGAPRASLIGVSAGAAALACLGLVALRHEAQP